LVLSFSPWLLVLTKGKNSKPKAKGKNSDQRQKKSVLWGRVWGRGRKPQACAFGPEFFPKKKAFGSEFFQKKKAFGSEFLPLVKTKGQREERRTKDQREGRVFFLEAPLHEGFF
jgi:hypothetical protein